MELRWPASMLHFSEWQLQDLKVENNSNGLLDSDLQDDPFC